MNNKHIRIAFTTISLCLTPAISQAQIDSCLEPAEPYPYKVDKKADAEFYNFIRKEFQTYFEDMEEYMRCLEHQRRNAHTKMQDYYRLWQRNFGPDAGFHYEALPEKRRDKEEG